MRILLVFLILIVAGGFGCGVRGDPIPPGAPAELGHGNPRYYDARNKIFPAGVDSPEDLKKADLEEKKEDER